jgi:hypothetical protein
MRVGSRHLVLLLLALSACERTGSSPSAPTLVGQRSWGETGIHIRVLEPGPELIGLWIPRDQIGLRGPGPWTISPSSLESSILELQPLPPGNRWNRLVLPLFPPPLPTELLILAREPLPASVYSDEMDLLTEFVASFDAGVVRRWLPELLRVARPLPVEGVDYLGTLENAVEIWNAALGQERFRLVEPGEMAEVVCELGDEIRLGYVRRLEQDAERHPLRMLIHLSPRWAQGAERYVQRAWLHELGHVLGLWGHSLDPRHLMHGSFIAVDLPNPEELTAVEWLWQIPHGTHMGWYRVPPGFDTPAPASRPRDDAKRRALTPRPTARADETVECHPGLR